MDHNQAMESRACEKYLLGELAPEVRDAYEEHYFSCPACVDELRAAAELFGASRVIFSEAPERTAARPGWLGWLKPVVLVPAFASLLAVVGYQSFVVIPRWKQAGAPRLLEMHSLIAANTRGEGLVFSVAPDEPFGLYVDVPADGAHSSYELRLEDPSGGSSVLRSVSQEEARKTQVVVVNPGKRAGRYAIVVSGLPAAGRPASAGPEEMGRLQFTVELRN
jgi:hypothetical protein